MRLEVKCGFLDRFGTVLGHEGSYVTDSVEVLLRRRQELRQLLAIDARVPQMIAPKDRKVAEECSAREGRRRAECRSELARIEAELTTAGVTLDG